MNARPSFDRSAALLYLYFIAESSDGPIKVGVSRNPGARLDSLQTGNPRKLQLFASYLFKREDALWAEMHYLDDMEPHGRRLAGEWVDGTISGTMEGLPDFFLSVGLEPIQ